MHIYIHTYIKSFGFGEPEWKIERIVEVKHCATHQLEYHWWGSYNWIPESTTQIAQQQSPENCSKLHCPKLTGLYALRAQREHYKRLFLYWECFTGLSKKVSLFGCWGLCLYCKTTLWEWVKLRSPLLCWYICSSDNLSLSSLPAEWIRLELNEWLALRSTPGAFCPLLVAKRAWTGLSDFEFVARCLEEGFDLVPLTTHKALYHLTSSRSWAMWTPEIVLCRNGEKELPIRMGRLLRD